MSIETDEISQVVFFFESGLDSIAVRLVYVKFNFCVKFWVWTWTWPICVATLNLRGAYGNAHGIREARELGV